MKRLILIIALMTGLCTPIIAEDYGVHYEFHCFHCNADIEYILCLEIEDQLICTYLTHNPDKDYEHNEEYMALELDYMALGLDYLTLVYEADFTIPSASWIVRSRLFYYNNNNSIVGQHIWPFIGIDDQIEENGYVDIQFGFLCVGY